MASVQYRHIPWKENRWENVEQEKTIETLQQPTFWILLIFHLNHTHTHFTQNFLPRAKRSIISLFGFSINIRLLKYTYDYWLVILISILHNISWLKRFLCQLQGSKLEVYLNCCLSILQNKVSSLWVGVTSFHGQIVYFPPLYFPRGSRGKEN